MDFQRIKPHLPWITLLVLVAIVGVANDTFLKPANLLSLAGDIVPLFVMALGLTLRSISAASTFRHNQWPIW